MVYDIELNSAALSRCGNRGIVSSDRAGRLRRLLEGRIEQHDPLILLSASRRALARSNWGRPFITFTAAVRSLWEYSPPPCRTSPAGDCCWGSVWPTRRLPPGTEARSTAPCAAPANTSISFARPPPESGSNIRARSIQRGSVSSFPGSPATPPSRSTWRASVRR